MTVVIPIKGCASLSISSLKPRTNHLKKTSLHRRYMNPGGHFSTIDLVSTTRQENGYERRRLWGRAGC